NATWSGSDCCTCSRANSTTCFAASRKRSPNVPRSTSFSRRTPQLSGRGNHGVITPWQSNAGCRGLLQRFVRQDQSVQPRELHGGGSSPRRRNRLAAERALRTSFCKSLLPDRVCIPLRQRRQLQPFIWLPIALPHGRTPQLSSRGNC